MYFYALVTYAPISFPTLFIHSLVEVHRSSSKSNGLFIPVFIHRILLHLGLDEFPASEPVHIIAPIGATFLWQRAAQMRASFKCPRVESSFGAPPSPPSSGDPTTEEYVDLIAAVNPPSTSSLSNASLRSMLEIVMTIETAQG